MTAHFRRHLTYEGKGLVYEATRLRGTRRPPDASAGWHSGLGCSPPCPGYTVDDRTTQCLTNVTRNKLGYHSGCPPSTRPRAQAKLARTLGSGTARSPSGPGESAQEGRVTWAAGLAQAIQPSQPGNGGGGGEAGLAARGVPAIGDAALPASPARSPPPSPPLPVHTRSAPAYPPASSIGTSPSTLRCPPPLPVCLSAAACALRLVPCASCHPSPSPGRPHHSRPTSSQLPAAHRRPGTHAPALTDAIAGPRAAE